MVDDCHQRLANQPLREAIDVADLEVTHTPVSCALFEVHVQGLSERIEIVVQDRFEVVLQVRHVREDLVGALRALSQNSFISKCLCVKSLNQSQHQSKSDAFPPLPIRNTCAEGTAMLGIAAVVQLVQRDEQIINTAGRR